MKGKQFLIMQYKASSILVRYKCSRQSRKFYDWLNMAYQNVKIIKSCHLILSEFIEK